MHRIKSDFFLPYDPALNEKAREMRLSPTPAEAKLWKDCLKGLKPQFLRQRPIDKFIVDFYCPNIKLVIEVDGIQHETGKGLARDSERTQILNSFGLHVIRFSNFEVMYNFEAVKGRVFDFLKSKLF